MFVPLKWPFITWARRSISFPNKIIHASWYFVLFLRRQYLSNSTVYPLILAPVNSQNVFNGNILNARFFGVSGAVVVSIYDDINYCVNVLVVRPLDHVLFADGSSSCWVM